MEEDWQLCKPPVDPFGNSSPMSITQKPFCEKDGRPIHLFTLRNAAGDEASISTLGATLTRWTAPDSGGHRASVVLGYNSPEPYLSRTLPPFRPVVGRFATRSANA